MPEPNARKVHWALRYPGVVAHVGNMTIDDGQTTNLADIKGPKSYNVTSLAFDPQTKRLFYTADNGMFRDLMSIDSESGESEMLLKDARIGELGGEAPERYCDPGPHAVPVHGVEPGALFSVWPAPVRHGYIAGRATAFDVIWRG